MLRVALWSGALFVGYLLLLVGLGALLEEVVIDKVEERMALSLDANVEVGGASVSLLRGRLELRDVLVDRMERIEGAERRRGGHLELGITHVTVDLAPLGWMVIDPEPSLVQVRGVEVSLSARGALTLPQRPERPPLRLGGMQVQDVNIAAMPTALLPKLGRLELHVDEARTGPVEVRSALDWLFALHSLHARATLSLIAGPDAPVEVHYQDQRLRVSAEILGAEPIDVPFVMPVPEPDDLELDKLRLLVRAVMQSVGKEAGARMRGKIARKWRELLD